MVKLLVEGKSDRMFLQDLMEVRLDKKKGTDFEIEDIGGWNNLEKNIPTIKRWNDEGHSVQIIFDADKNHHDRRKHIEQFGADHDLNFDVFLFPDNASNGNLETLLERIVHDKHRRVLDCFQQYEDCLEKCNEDEEVYAIPTRKSKIYAYVDAFPKSNKASQAFKDGDFLYKDSSIWNLNSEKIAPLVNFLIGE